MMGSFMAMNTHARYYWNGENRMMRMEVKSAPANGQSAALEFAYDHMGRCVARNGERYVWDGCNIVAEVADPSNVVYNIWGLDLDGTFQGLGGVGGLLAVERDGRLSLTAYDANGNVTEYVGLDDGAVLSHSEYSAFGGVLRRNGATAFSHGFSTKPSDMEGSARYQLRILDTGIGRWISRDGLGELGDKSLYLYVRNSPHCSQDILGLVMSFMDCHRAAQDAWNNSEKVKSLLSLIKGNGCSTPSFMCSCKENPGSTVGHYGAKSNLITIETQHQRLGNSLSVESVLIHELVHALDHCCKYNFDDCEEHALSELKAYHAGGSCRKGSGYEECLKRRATNSIRGKKACRGRDIAAVLQRAYEKFLILYGGGANGGRDAK